MKNRIALLLTIILSVPLVSLAPAIVRADDSSHSDETTTTNHSDDKVKDDTSAAEYQKELEARLAKRKEEWKSKITSLQQSKIKTKCKAAQGLVASVSARTKEFKTNRTDVYTKIINKLTELSTKLKANNIDTTELDAEIAQLQTMVDTFKTNLTDMHQSAADVANMDCTTDPTGFKASLEELRTKRESITTESKAIRAYIVDTIKPSLQTIKEAVKASKETEANQ